MKQPTRRAVDAQDRRRREERATRHFAEQKIATLRKSPAFWDKNHQDH